MKTIKFTYTRYGQKFNNFVESDSISNIATEIDTCMNGVQADLNAIKQKGQRCGWSYQCEISEEIFFPSKGLKFYRKVMEFMCFFCEDNGNWYADLKFGKDGESTIPICRTDSLSELKRVLDWQRTEIICRMFDRISRL